MRSKNKCLILPIKEGREQTLFIYITKHRYKVRCTSTLEKRIYIYKYIRLKIKPNSVRIRF